MTTSKIYNIEIQPLDRGYLVKVGCKEIAFTSRKKLVKELSRYLKNPLEVELEYFQSGQNSPTDRLSYDLGSITFDVSEPDNTET